MPGTDGMLVWLRAAMDAAQRDAEAATPGPWEPEGDDPTDDMVHTVHDGKHGDLVGKTVAHVRGGNATAANMRHIARHDPAAVLRRITADRKLLDLHQNVNGKCWECGQGYELTDWGPDFPCTTVRLLAEGYGWTEGQ
ncbi:DUF6221 family protein [Streptomyces sp. NPDC055722]